MVEMDFAQKIRRGHEYAEALEEERRKIQVFQRELPLCLELVTQAIEACKKEISGGSTTTDYMQGQSDCSEQTTSDVPVLEEFIPIKKSSDCSEEDDEQESDKSKEKNVPAAVDHERKSDWLRSVQLWNNNNNQSPDLPLNEDAGNNGSGVEVKENGGAFQPFQREKVVVKSVQPSAVGKANASATSTSTTESKSRGEGGEANNGNSSKKDEKEGQTQRKTRRCWSPELHRRFLHALHQLGGSHAATPKQIRELMKVDGLTNDEVKSHLQKYRLHTRRPSPSVQHSANPQAPQFVVVGGIWVPPPEYSTMTATTSTKTATDAPSSGIYTPVATLATVAQPCGTSVQRHQQSHSEERGSHSEGRVHSTSSSTHATTDSPAY
ncbi:transcription factor HHO2-like isoform X1 [Hibiscus syriacus]|uniref:transcription factor HHO2-like isoform X1 n=1 Tax=Hibiscus syriacus TaxID=106335 RepID=UPI001921A777|nr:transcription factor HHO2-like isoform X1 [Hibiscus syriacus]